MWLPGRTASVMTLFCLVAMSAYARFERFSARAADPPRPTPDDVPKSKTAVVVDLPVRSRWVWFGVSVFAVTLALGSYEQAIMLPALLVATAMQGASFGSLWVTRTIPHRASSRSARKYAITSASRVQCDTTSSKSAVATEAMRPWRSTIAS